MALEVMRDLLRSIRYWTRGKLGSAPTETFARTWARRSIEDVRQEFPNIALGHRPWIADHLTKLGDFGTLLEVGSGWGPNLHILAKRFPAARFIGVDINPNAVSEGNAQIDAAGIRNVRLELGRAEDLSAFRTSSFDIVLTDALLLYIGPDKFDRVRAELLRVAARYLVLCEMHGRQRLTADGWLRDYGRAFPGRRVALHRVPPNLRSGRSWSRFGRLAIVSI